MSVRIEYKEQDLHDVFAYWVKDYESENGYRILKSDYFVDIATRKVIFKLYIQSKVKTEAK